MADDAAGGGGEATGDGSAAGEDDSAADGVDTGDGDGVDSAAGGDATTADPRGAGDSDAPDREAYEVFVQWRRGEPHEHAETIDAPDPEMALLLAKRNVDVRSEPVDVMVAPRSEMRRTVPGDTTLVPSTDRSYREVAWYAADDREGEY